MNAEGTHLDKIREQFTRQAEAYIRMRQTTDERGLRALVMLAGVWPEHRVLDVACGPGFLTMALATRCTGAVGIDATTAFLAHARAEALRRGLTNIEFCAGDAEGMPFEDTTFDRVTCRAAFHHLPRPARVLAEMVRVMRPDGRLVIADMLGSEDSGKAEYRDHMERLCDPTHVRALPASAFATLFSEAGLCVELQPRTSLHTDADEWIAHGGPNATDAARAIALMEASVDVDRCGLDVRRENGTLRFSYPAVVYVVRRG